MSVRYPSPVQCSTLWKKPTVNPITKKKYRVRSKVLGRHIKDCKQEWLAVPDVEECDIFKKFGEVYSPMGRRLSPGVRTRWHRKCSPLRRGRKGKSHAQESPKSPKSPKSPVTKSYCNSAGLQFRRASCVKPRSSKRSPAKKSMSPSRKSRSPSRRSMSPSRKLRSPSRKSRSPSRKSSSMATRYKRSSSPIPSFDL